jgi:hypothetical protein
MTWRNGAHNRINTTLLYKILIPNAIANLGSPDLREQPPAINGGIVSQGKPGVEALPAVDQLRVVNRHDDQFGEVFEYSCKIRGRSG